jgi:hypothetical protein
VIVDTRVNKRFMHSAAEPFVLCERMHPSHPARLTALGRYSTLQAAKRALRRRK